MQGTCGSIVISQALGGQLNKHLTASLYNGDCQPGEAVCANDLVAAGTSFAYPVQENQLGTRFLHQFLEIGHIRLQESKLV